MRFILYILLLIPIFANTQNCSDCYGLPTIVNAQIEGNGPYTYNWICSDGSTGESQNHQTDTLFGTVNCIVDITDINGCSVSQNVTITPTVPPTLVIQNNSCVISWQTQILNSNICSGFILERSTNAGSTWSTVSNSLPFTTTVNGLFRIKYSCDCGIYYSNTLTVTDCTTCTPFEIADAGDCLWIISGIFPCNTEDYTLWQSINNSIVCGPSACTGASYTALYSNDDGFGFVNNDGCYYVTTSCNGINYCSNVICIDDGCDAGCSGAIAASQDDCDLDVTWALCTTNSYALQYKSGSSWINYTTGVSSPPTTFAIPFNGIWRVVQSCTDGCTYNSAQFTFTECGCNNDTQVVIFQQPNPCESSAILAASVSQCGPGFTPTFLWSTGATTQSITVGTGTYTVTVSNCCESTNSTKIVSCSNPCGSYDVQIAGAITICNNTTTILTGNVLSGLGPYTYSWLVNGIPFATTSNIVIDGSDYSLGNVNVTLTITDANGCSDVDLHTVLITDCTDECDCTPVLSLDEENCELTYYSNNCDGFTVYLQRLITGTWTNIATSPANPYTVTIDGSYRIKEVSVECGTFYSNVVTASCTECILFGEMSLGSQCGRINFEWTYNGENEVEVTFAYPTTNVDDCEDADGWVNFYPEAASWSQSSKTGYLDLFEHCDKCIRIIFDDGDCTPADAYIVVPCCCEGSYTINTESEDYEYIQTIQGDYDIGEQPSMFKVRESTGQLTQVYVETEIELNGSPFDTETFGTNVPMFSLHQVELDGTTDCITDLKFKVNTTTHTLNLDPSTTPYLSGPFGTVTAAHLRPLNGATFTQSVTAIKTLLLNAMVTVVPSITTNDVKVGTETASKASPTFDENILVAIKPKWNSTTWINDGDFPLLENQSGELSVTQNDNAFLISSDDCTTLSGTPTSIQYNIDCDYTSDCGVINQTSPTIISYWSAPSCTNAYVFDGTQYGKSLLNTCLYGGCPLYSSINIPTDFEVWSIVDAGDGSDITESIDCSQYTLSVDSPCIGATYLWSTGQTTASIIVGEGDYSVIISCPDDCEYVENISVP